MQESIFINKNIKPILILIVAVSIQGCLQGVNFQNPDEMLRFVKPLLPINPVILEAGGHFGEDTQRMKKIWPNATIHVFEPLPSSFERLVSETRNLLNITCYPYALTNFAGKTHFYIDLVNPAASSIGHPVAWNAAEFQKTPIEVSCITINDWVDLYSVPSIDFMWLDMEGQELNALRHASKILKNVKCIYTEVSYIPIREDSGLYSDLKLLLETYDFYEVWKNNYAGVFGEALFVKKETIS